MQKAEWKETIPPTDDQKLIKELRKIIREKTSLIDELMLKIKELESKINNS